MQIQQDVIKYLLLNIPLFVFLVIYRADMKANLVKFYTMKLFMALIYVVLGYFYAPLKISVALLIYGIGDMIIDSYLSIGVVVYIIGHISILNYQLFNVQQLVLAFSIATFITLLLKVLGMDKGKMPVIFIYFLSCATPVSHFILTKQKYAISATTFIVADTFACVNEYVKKHKIYEIFMLAGYYIAMNLHAIIIPE
ncbi:Hypothetical_protein [Hexamita inflata]|uniref:Hypothetical_protein n=1 Tax=Hexamita inflata TaxID=28002 RepID=A0AA86R150_9EUKA|nr:Hypothetical protein HINF_LOCUS54822 [Hexamita inflata]